MCKRFVWTVCLMVLISPAYAQGKKEIIRKGAGALTEQVETQVGRQVAGQTLRKGTSRTAAAARNAGRSAAAKIYAKASSTALRKPGSSIPASTTRGFSKIPTQENHLNTVEGLVKKHIAQSEEQKRLAHIGAEGGFGRSVLFVNVGKPEIGYGVSLSVIQTHFHGKDEIFGVIATHMLPESYYTYQGSLHRFFEVLLKQPDGTDYLGFAEVVQVSPRSMLDISLVKFDPQTEKLLRPLEIALSPAEVNEMLYSYGYANGIETIADRLVQANSFISVRTPQNLRGERRGFCGSPLLDAQGKVKAFHTGTLEGNELVEDISYATHAGFIEPLVEAYHNDGNATYNLVLNGQHLAVLDVDEYITHFQLRSSNGKILSEKPMGKFSQTLLLEQMQRYPQARYLDIFTHKLQWFTDDSGGSVWHLLLENHNPGDPTLRRHRYNLQTRQIEPIP